MRWATEAMVWADAWPSWAWVLVGVALLLVAVVLLRLRGVEVVVEVRPMRPGWKPGELHWFETPEEQSQARKTLDHDLHAYKLAEYRRHNGRVARVRTDGMSEEE